MIMFSNAEELKFMNAQERAEHDELVAKARVVADECQRMSDALNQFETAAFLRAKAPQLEERTKQCVEWLDAAIKETKIDGYYEAAKPNGVLGFLTGGMVFVGAGYSRVTPIDWKNDASWIAQCARKSKDRRLKKTVKDLFWTPAMSRLKFAWLAVGKDDAFDHNATIETASCTCLAQLAIETLGFGSGVYEGLRGPRAMRQKIFGNVYDALEPRFGLRSTKKVEHAAE